MKLCPLLRDNYPGVLTENNDLHDLDDYLDVSKKMMITTSHMTTLIKCYPSLRPHG